MIVGYKGRWKYKQFNASKPHKYHIKSFGLCDSSNGYVLNLLTYYGSNTSFDPCTESTANAVKIFDKLLQCVGTGYHIFADRWYTTRVLVDYLLDQKQYFTGTVQSNRVGFPKDAKQMMGNALQQNTSKYFASADNAILYCVFKDKKAKNPALLVSTKSAVGDVITTRKQVPKPVIVDSYNQYMSGCDRADQLIGYYGHQNRRSTKWWKKLFFWSLEITMLNAYIMYRESRPNPPTKSACRSLSFLNFKKSLIQQLEAKSVRLTDVTALPSIGGAGDSLRLPVGRPKKRPASTPIEKLTPGQHIIEKGEKLRRCLVCSKPDAVSRTYYVCKTCPSKPNLHPDTCFAAYHS